MSVLRFDCQPTELGKDWRGAWAPWLRKSDDARVGWGLVIAQWPEERGRHPGAKSHPEVGVPAWLRATAELTRDPYFDLCSFARAVSEGTMTELARHGIRRTPHQLSELVATHLLAASKRLGRTPRDQAEIDDIVSGLVTRIGSSSEPMDQDAFAASAADLYDQLWTERGADALHDFPPYAIGLGSNRRPPLLPDSAAAARGRSGLALGTDRSVYGRYTLHHHFRARSKPRGNSAPNRPRPSDPGDRIDEELERVCSPYGLATLEHRYILRTLAQGADLTTRTAVARTGEIAPHGTWQAWRSSATPISPDDPELLDAIRDYVDGWQHSVEAQLLAQRYGELVTHVAVIGSAAVCKLWMDLHRREREHTTPALRPDVAHYISNAFGTTVPQALGHWVGPEEEDEGDSGGGPPQSVIDYAERLRATSMRLLDESRDGTTEGPQQLERWGEAIRAGDFDLVHAEFAAFVERAAADGVGAERLLTAEELIELLIFERGGQP